MRLKRSGFSLVLSLTIMAAMVMMVIVLASFLQIESRLAQSHSGYLRARFNALASARIAIGQLQQLAGPDQRVTMRADMFADNEINAGNNDAPTIAPVRGRPDRTNNHAPLSAKLHHQKRYLTGVWSTGGADSSRVRDWDVANPADSRLFLGWLASPFDENASPELSGTTPNFVPNRDYFRVDIDAQGVSRNEVAPGKLAEVRAYIDDILPNPIDADSTKVIPLVSFGSVNIPSTATGFRRNYFGAVDARPQPMPGPAFSDPTKSLGVNGRYAFWIGDEGVKAKINLPDFYAATTGGAWLSTEDWDKGFAASANQRNSLGVLGGAGDPLKEGVNTKGALPAGFNFDVWRAKDIADAAGKPQAYQLAKAVGTSGLSAWAVSQGGVAAGDAMNLAAKLLWHDITTLSYSTLTDTYNGGVKVDLSTAFELPYAMYRGIELYPGQKDTAITTDYRLRKQSLFHGAPNAALTTAVIGANGMGVDLDYNRPNLVDKLGSDSQLLRASPRASEWAPRFVKNLLGSSYELLRARNGGSGTAANAQSESPERLGFVYEAPLRSAFFESYPGSSGNTVSRLLANTERSPNATTSTWTVTSTINTLTERINVLPWSELAVDHPENLTGRIIRGPTWDLYRNYYRMYKRELEQAGKTSGTLRGQPTAAPDAVFARGVEPLTYASGNRFAPVQKTPSLSGSGTGGAPRALAPRPDNFYQGGGALDDNRYYYRNNLSAPSDSPSFQAEQRLRYPNIIQHRHATLAGFGTNVVTNHDRMGIALPRPASNDAYFDNLANAQLTTRTWPTSMSLAPSIVRFSMVFSGIFDQADSFDENGELNLGTIGVTVDPVVMVHNPYDVAIEFEGIAMVTNGSSLPYIFDVVLENWFFRDTHWQFYDPYRLGSQLPRTKNLADPLWVGETLSHNLLLGEIALGDGREENRSVSFRLVNPGQKFRLEPGEVKTISTKNIPGASQSGRKINTTITTNNFGYDLGSNALYRMTPFANVRYRFGDIPSQFNDWPIPSVYNARTTPDPRLWTWGFSQINRTTGKTWVAPIPTGEGATPWFGFLGNYCYKNAGGAGDVNPSAFQDALTLWNDVKNSRRIRDGLPTWKGDAKTLKTILDFPPAPNPPGSKNLSFRARNSGWMNYDHRVVGEEGKPGEPGYVFPRVRNGTTAVSGHQHWNFYLLNNRSIDGQALSPTRRWFGSPRTANPIYNEAAGTVSNYVSEGSVTAEGQHLVDESLLLNFQALTAGWPNYGNDNGHWNNIIQYNEEWKNLPNVGLSPRLPDYRISTGLVQNSHTGINWRGDVDAQNTQVSFGPQDGDPEFGRPEITAGHRANSLGGRLNTPVWSDRGDTKQPFLLTDFVLRSAEMTERTLNVWYPSSATSSVFKFNSGSLTNLTTPVDTVRAPMSPFFLSVRSQQAHLFGYDGKAHTPIGWVLSQRRIDSEPQIALAANNVNAYWGGSVSPSSNTRSDTILFPIPRRPLLSLAQLGSVGFAQVNTDADLTVGASFAHPGIMDLTKVTDWPGPKAQSGKDKAIPENGWVGIHEGTRIIRNRANVRTDHAFLANLALWDSYYFSGLNLAANSYSLPGSNFAFPSGPDLETDTDVAQDQASALKKATGDISSYDVTSFRDYKIALESGYNPLANKRVVFQPDNRAAVADGTFPGATEFPHPAYLSRNALYDGGFNVNSTSKQAWKTVLAGMRGQTLPDGSPASGTVLTRFARSFKPTTTPAGVWNDHRELSDAEIDKLAAEVVKEVRDRGPFMSLGDFINRRLLDSDLTALRGHGLKGALQAAIDKSGINSAAIGNSAGLVADGLFAAQGELNLSTSFSDPNGNTGGRSGTGRANFTDKNGDGGGTLGVLKKATNPTAARFPNVASMSETNNDQKVVAAVGAPQIVNQMDVLNTVGPNLTARSDTFTVRAYGEALDNAGNTIGRAWIEVVVQRTAQLMLPSSRGPGYDEATRRKSAYRVNGATTKEYDSLPMVDPYESLNAGGILRLPTNATPFERENWHINRILGRRFKATSIRWLNANEI